jgi:hypothetical protein
MARPPINTGSSALQAYMQGVANMGQVRAQMQQNTTNAINALGDTFTKWQDDFNKRKHLKWTQQMEEAKLAESKRVNDSNIKVNEGTLALNQEAASYINKQRAAQTALTNSQTKAQNLSNYATGKAIESVNKGGGWGGIAPSVLGAGTTPPAAAAQQTGNATRLNIGGVPLGQNGSNEASSGMGVINGVKKQSTTSTNANANGYASGQGINNYYKAIGKA